MRPFSKLPPVTKPNVFLAIPTREPFVHAETAALCSSLNMHPQVKWGFVSAMSPELSRNSLIEHHFHNDPQWTHIFFIDSDVIPPGDALKKLLLLDADIATGYYPLFLDGAPVWSIKDAEDHWITVNRDIGTEPFETPGCGGGCLLIRKPVLVEMGWPWFKTEYREIFNEDNPEGRSIKSGEDVFFVTKAKESGFKTIVEPTVVCEHERRVKMKAYLTSIKELCNGSDD